MCCRVRREGALPVRDGVRYGVRDRMRELYRRPLSDAVSQTLTIINVSVYPAATRTDTIANTAVGPNTVACTPVYPLWQRKLEHVISNLEVWSASDLRTKIEDAEDEMLHHWKVLHESITPADKREAAQLRRGFSQLRQLRMSKSIAD